MCMQHLNKIEKRVLLFVLMLFVLFVGILIGASMRHHPYNNVESAHIAFDRLNGLQQIAFMHDRMQIGEVRYVWRQEYCGKKHMTMGSPVIEPMDGRLP
jgi:hypothetical protein